MTNDLYDLTDVELDKLGDRKHLDSLEKEALEDLWNQVSDKHASIKEQLMRARGRAAAEGIYSDPDWLASAERARRHTARQLQEIQKAVGRKGNTLKHQLNELVTQRNDLLRELELMYDYTHRVAVQDAEYGERRRSAWDVIERVRGTFTSGTGRQFYQTEKETP